MINNLILIVFNLPYFPTDYNLQSPLISGQVPTTSAHILHVYYVFVHIFGRSICPHFVISNNSSYVPLHTPYSSARPPGDCSYNIEREVKALFI